MLRTVTALVVSTLLSSVMSPVDPSAPGRPDGSPERREPARLEPRRGPDQLPWTASSVAPVARPVGERPATVDFPEPGRWEVDLRAAGRSAAVTGGRAGPVGVTDARDAGAKAAGGLLRIEIHAEATADRLGMSGFVFTVSDPSTGGNGVMAKGAGPVDLAIDYSGFENAYGGGYADRLRVVALPDCAVLDPVPRGCDVRGVPLTTRNNRDTDTLTARLDNLAAPATTTPVPPGGNASVPPGGAGRQAGSDDRSAVFAVTADVAGETGTYGATPLSVVGEWQVAPGSGEFNWSYPLSLPAPPSGSAPQLGLSYSSGSIDGLTNATNPQGSPVGLGWGDIAGGFIERRYEPCINAQHVPTRDLCWKGQNGTISLAGVSGAMFPLDGAASRWAVQYDEGWRVERLTGASGNGDNDGEYWKVTAVDGTQYFFGQRIDASLLVPVVADSPGEPCYATSSCKQTWRWMLDRVVDPNGNTATYRYEKYGNRYRSVEGLGVDESYNPSAILTSIEYGSRGGIAAPARIVFEHAYRCAALGDSCTSAPNKNNGESFPDTPNDLICSSACTTYSPTFFNPWRYLYAYSEVRLGQTYKPVMRWNLTHGWGKDSTNAYPKLLVTNIQAVGLADADGDGDLSLLPRPAVDLVYGRYANRVDADRAAGRDPMENWRLTRIVNELRGETRVSYGHSRPCPANYTAPADRWDLHAMDCFPQSVKEGNPPTTRRGVFHKYLVGSVTDMPMDGGANIRTDYTYEDAPAWSYVLDAWTGYDATWAWANWRGYATVLTVKGTSRTRTRVFRGMHKDKVLRPVGGGGYELDERDVPINDLDGNSFWDERTLAGRVLQQERLSPLPGAAEERSQSTSYGYEVRVTQPDLPGGVAEHRWPRWAGVVSTVEKVYSAPGQFRERRGETTYTARLQPATSTEHGWADVGGDERCTATSYAENPAAGMFNYPATNKVVAGTDCAGTDPAKVVSYSETAYDGLAVGAAPTRGNPTLQRTRISGTRFAETRTGFDDWGRPTQVTDPNGGITRTVYKACRNTDCTVQELGLIPNRIEVTNALGHTTVTDYLQQYGVPTKITDPNGTVTRYGYDGLGRMETVSLPDAPLAFAEPSFRYSYDMPNRSVRTRQLVSAARTGADVRFIDTWTVYDGLGRERQAQSQSPAAGKVLVGETTYDGRGLTLAETAPQAVTGTPGTLLTVAAWANRTQYGYDVLGRKTTEDRYRSTDLVHTTTTGYAVDTVTVTGPEGNRVRQTVDGLGRTVGVAEHDGTGWVSTSYAYDLADRPTRVTDPAGNVVTYTYDLAGRRVGQADPDRGAATFTYDDAGNQTAGTDGNGTTVSTVYDPLNRARERWIGAPSTGTRTASWFFDAPGQLGLFDKEVRHTATGDWVSDVTGYDVKNRVTSRTLTVPAGIPGLSGTYPLAQTYNRADQVVTTTLPAVGGLPAETVTATYDSLGLPSTMTSGLEAYVRGEVYDDRGRLTQSTRGPDQPGTTHLVLRAYSYNADQQRDGIATYVRTAQAGWNHSLVSADRLSYDKAGRLAEREVWQGDVAAASWSECYRYDARQRLVAAHTIAGAAVSGSADCATATPGGGSRPYVHQYAYTVDGRFDTRTEDGTQTRYEYPVAGRPRAHAPTSVGGDTYGWNDTGNLVSRGTGATAETFTWDAEQRLTSVEHAGQTTSFVYDPAGQRLLRRTAGEATLYWAGHEITANADGTRVTAVRPYGLNGETIATRSPAGVQYLAANEAGSVEAAVTAPGQPATAQREYGPYGAVRHETGTFQTDRGFLGQVEDASTDLSYLNARYYDAAAGIFISPDPLYDTSEPKTLNPYAYGLGNPTTLSDPSGLSPLDTSVLEGQVNSLVSANTRLVNEVKRLGGIIGDLQNVILENQNAIKQLLTYIGSLESFIRQQQSIIDQLEVRVASLTRQVNYWRNQANYWRGQAMYWRGQAMYWKGQATYWRGKAVYYRGVIDKLVRHAFQPGYADKVLGGIDAGKGVRSWAGSNVVELLGYVDGQNGVIDGLIKDKLKLSGQVSNLKAGNEAAMELAIGQASRIDELEWEIEYGYLKNGKTYFCAMAGGSIPYDHDPVASTLGRLNQVSPTSWISSLTCQFLLRE